MLEASQNSQHQPKKAQSVIGSDGMMHELQCWMNESQALATKLQEYQRQSTTLHQEYRYIQNRIIVTISKGVDPVLWKPDEWTPLSDAIQMDQGSSGCSPSTSLEIESRRLKMSESGTTPQLRNQTMDPVVSLFTEMGHIRKQINAVNRGMTYIAQSKDALDQSIENLLRRWSLHSQSGPNNQGTDLLEREINLLPSARPIPPSRRQIRTMRLSHELPDYESALSKTTPQLADQSVDQVSYFQELLAKYRNLMRESRALKDTIDSTELSDPLHAVHTVKYQMLQADIQALETHLKRKNFFE